MGDQLLPQLLIEQYDTLSNSKIKILEQQYSKTCVKQQLKIDKTKILMTNGLTCIKRQLVLKTNFMSF